MSKKRTAIAAVIALSIVVPLSACTINIGVPAQPATSPAISSSTHSPDKDAIGDLANIAYAEEFNLANTGTYAGSYAELIGNAQKSIADGGSGPKVTISKGVKIGIDSDPKSYKLYAESTTGHVYSRSSDSASTSSYGTIAKYESDRKSNSALPELTAP
jgi:hypothetical protein